jgi:hypothetical protein
VKEVRIDRAVLAAIRRQDKSARKRIGEAIAAAQDTFGDPHGHSGAGVRKLKGSWYETRAGLGLRLIFKDCGDCLSFEFMGRHDEVRRFLKGAK